MTNETMDVVIIGGGPGGLSAALVLGRALKKIAVIDDGQARNLVTKASNGFLTRDGIDPKELKEIAHSQMEKYPNVRLFKDTVVTAKKEHGFFITSTKSGAELKSKKLIFSTGLRDHLPAIPGLKEVYGTSVFHCPYCDGWERKNEPLAVFGNGEGLLAFVKIIYNWSKDLAVFTNGKAELSTKDKQQLVEKGIQLIEAPITALQSQKGFLQFIKVSDGTTVKRTGGFMLHTGEKQATLIPANLGVPQNEKGEYITKEHGETELEGLFIIGDAKNTFVSIAGAVGQGYETGVKINGLLAEEQWA